MASKLTTADEPDPVNYVHGLMDFLRRWESREECSAAGGIELATSSAGNINIAGQPDCYVSYLMTRWHPEFLVALEPGVAQLVLALIETWDCVTYSSCEGHPAAGSTPARPRHVRIVVRDHDEYARLRSALEELAARTNAACPDAVVQLRARSSVVTSDAGIEAPGLDLLFVGPPGSETAYFEEADRVYAESLVQLEAMAGSRPG